MPPVAHPVAPSNLLEPTAFNTVQAVWIPLFRSLMRFWSRKFTNKPAEFPKELFLVKRLVHILGLAKLLPPPFHYASELFDFITSQEIGEIMAKTLWPRLRMVNGAPPFPRAVSIPSITVSPSISLNIAYPKSETPADLNVILKVLKAHCLETAHLFALFYATRTG